jgi:hypothetical protein
LGTRCAKVIYHVLPAIFFVPRYVLLDLDVSTP